MSRYTFICENFKYDEFTGDETGVAAKHTTEFRADDLNSVLEEFEMFLKGSGFHFDGVIDVVKPEEEQNWDDEEEMFSDLLITPSNPKPAMDQSNVWSKVIERHMTDMENETIQRGTCEICKLPLETMLQHNCYDDQCPLKMK
jgi:hypothetical protein